MKKFLLCISLFIVSFQLYSQNKTVRGFIYDQSNGEPLAFEKVKVLSVDSATIAGAVTDLNGFFQIPMLESKQYLIKVDNFKYEEEIQNLDLSGKRNIIDVKFELKILESVQQFDEVKVSAESKTKRTNIEISKLKISKEGLERIPSYGAENDIVGAFSVTPGVITTGDQGGQLYVRGGTPIQNKILLDGMTIYNPFHSIGFFSIFETELIKNVDIYTGGFESKYGGRISSIMDITYRDGNRKKFAGKASVSPFLGKLVLEGPLGKSKGDSPRAGSYIFSAKKSLLDLTSERLYPGINEGNGLPFNFTDLYGKLTFTGDGGSKFSAFGFSNQDSVNYSIADLNWNAAGGGINFLLVPSGSPIFIRGHVNGSNFSTTFTENAMEPRTSSIGGFDLGFDFSYFLKNEGEINYGFNLNGFNTKYTTFNEVGRKIEDENFTTEIGGYYNYRGIFKRWVVQIGARAQYYASLNTLSLEPRIGAKYNASDNIRFKFSGGRFSQNFTSASSDKDIVNLFNGLLSAPTNVQDQFVNQFGNSRQVDNGLQYAWHAIAGVEVDLGKNIMVNLEGYYKYFSQLSNINQNKLYDDVAAFELIDDVFKKDFIIESGESLGADLLIKYSKNRLFLWGVYSYGYNIRWDGFNEYYPVFDRRHNINLVGSYIFGKNKDIDFNIRWNLGSGLPFTPTAGFFQSENFSDGVTTDPITNNTETVSTILGQFNSQRLPYYHRFDVTLKKKFKFKNKTIMEVVLSVTNAYNRKNIFYVNRVTNEEIYQFPLLPSFGVSYKF